MIHPSRIFAVLLLLFLISVSYFSVHSHFLTIFVPILIALSFSIILFWQNRKLRFLFLILLSIFLGVWRVSVFQNQIKTENFGKEMSVSGVIIEEPKISGRIQQLIIKRDGGREIFSVVTGQFPEYYYGQKIEVEGKISKPEKDSEFKGFFKSKNILGTILFPEVSAKGYETSSYVRVRRELINSRKGLEDKIKKLIPEPESGFLSGILFGTKAALTDEFSFALSRTGTFHIVALSGFNITIVAEFLRLLTKRFSKRLSFILPLLGIWTFVLATGLSASVVRAAIMGSLIILAGFIGRKSDSLVAILFASTIMVFLNPNILLWDIGFQLSFAATIGILFLSPLIEKWFSFFGGFGTYVSATVAAQVLTWPITSYYFGNVSLVAPVVNMFILPFVPVVMFLGLVTAVIAYILPSLSQILALLSWFILAYFSKVINVFSGFSYTSLDYKIVSVPIVVGYYLLLLDLIMIFKRRKFAKKAV